MFTKNQNLNSMFSNCIDRVGRQKEKKNKGKNK